MVEGVAVGLGLDGQWAVGLSLGGPWAAEQRVGQWAVGLGLDEIDESEIFDSPWLHLHELVEHQWWYWDFLYVLRRSTNQKLFQGREVGPWLGFECGEHETVY